MKIYEPGLECYYLNVTCLGVNLAGIKLTMISLNHQLNGL